MFAGWLFCIAFVAYCVISQSLARARFERQAAEDIRTLYLELEELRAQVVVKQLDEPMRTNGHAK